MNQDELSQKLVTTNGLLVIDANTLGDDFKNFLVLYYGGGPITISAATLSPDPQPDGAIVFTGTSNFGPTANLPVTARFRVDAAGKANVELRYALRGTALEANPWVFSRSFPDLPTEYDSLTRKRRVNLDTLDLFDTAMVLVTHESKDRLLDVPLVPGLNFVSRLRPSGLLGAFEYTASKNTSTVIYGVIILAKPTDLIVPLKPMEYPWDRLGSTSPPPLPGIYLQTRLDLGFSVGKLALRETRLRTYTPISTSWMQNNPGFYATQAYTATLAIPSAKIEVNLRARMHWGQPVCILDAQCSGITLGKLDHMLDLAGSDGLLECVPNELKKPIETLEKLELMQVGLDIVASDGLPTVRAISFTVGFPNLKWNVWSDSLVVDSLSCRFVIFEPFSPTPAPTTSTTSSGKFKLPFLATVNGILRIEDIPVSVTAASSDNFAIHAQTLGPANLPLDRLVKKHGPGVPVPSALTVNYLEVNVWFGKAYSMYALLAGAPDPWTIRVGKRKFVMSDVALSFTKPANGNLSGSMSGSLELLDGVLVQANYEIPGNFVIRGMLPRMSLSELIDGICDRPVKLPRGLNFTMQYASILIREQGQQKTFLLQLVAQIEGLGMLAFETRQASDGTWGFAYGLELLAGTPSNVAGLGALAALEKMLKLRKFLIVASSLDQPGFQLPDTAQFNNPYLPTKKVSLPGSGGVVAGLNIFAEWGVDPNDKQQKLLKGLLGLGDTVQVTIQVGENPVENCKLFYAASGKLRGQPFQYRVGAMFTNGQPSFFLTGSLTLNVQKQPVTFDLTTAFVPTGAYMSANMKSPKPIDCGPFKLGNVGIEIGVNWAGLPSLGLTATIDVKNFESSIAIFFDANNPAQSLVAGSVSDLTLKDVVDTMLGSKISSSIDDVLDQIRVKGTREFSIAADLADELNDWKVAEIASAFQKGGNVQIPSDATQVLVSTNKKGEVWHVTDLLKMRHYALKKNGQKIAVTLETQFYFAPQATAIGTIAFPQGFFLNGAVDIMGWKAEATIDIQANRGVSVDAQMDTISIGKQGLFSISAANGNGGPQLSISTMPQPSHPTPEFRQPHVFINGSVQLLGLKGSVLASLTAKGLILQLEGKLAPGAEFDLDIECSSAGLTVNGDITIGIGTIDLGDLGKIKIDTDLEGAIGIKVNAREASLVVEASFSFLGEDKSLGRITLDTNPDELNRLANTMAKKVEDFLRKEFVDAGKWANAVKNGVVDGVDDTAKVLTKVYGKSEKEAAAVAKDIGKGAKSVGKTVSKTAKKLGKKLKKIF
jgi:hypothetical protein